MTPTSYNANPEDEKEYEFVGEALVGSDIVGKIIRGYWESYFKSSYKEMTEVIDFLIHYSKWIPGEQMEKLFSTVSNPDWLKENYFNDCIDKVIEYVHHARECYLRGEQPKHEEPVKEIEDYFNDYDAAIDMLIMAEKLEEIDTGYISGITSIDKPFDKVMIAALQGNVEAKFIAGKHLIADNIKKERKRAIQWIREAADAGHEEAIKCIEKHPDVFSEG